ncbi:NAD-dependent epimerase/dehydratase family protein [Mariniblastus fucicola]|uniref:UDP-glucose 4-epimerase n=1 Tax=Mariniblastus fucicola TaxID=980251 RepID=A0A5B9P5P6_9BACT|nr:NAD(P)-dependent oxidoreductase [Mariniblastus fucicola]QEG20302.1 UDP-glucose 4-epimerase [Mariniblastus fucicola]
MKVLITGGAGFIGSYFAETLIDMGHDIISLDIAPPSKAVDDVDYQIGDIRNAPRLRSLVDGVDAVLHLAAAHHDFGISESTFESVNVDGTRNLCDAMSDANVKHICFFSTVAVYGNEAVPPISEVSEPRPSSPYGVTKFRAEGVLENWTHQENDRKCLIIRPTVTFGAENYANMFSLIRQIEMKRYVKIGAGKNIKSLSYVENIVDAVIQIWLGDRPTRQQYQVFNYIDKPDLSSEQIADIIYDELGFKPPGLRIPFPLARALALPFDLAILLTGKNFPISGARIRKLAKDQTKYESQSIIDHGVSTKVPLEEGIRKMVRWYMKTGRHRKKSEIRRSIPSKLG